MNPTRRNLLSLAAGAALLPAAPHTARSQSYPLRPVRVVVGFAPGGAADIVARLISQWLSERLGQPFIVENRPGAGTNIGTESVVRAAPDGYTLLLISGANANNATLYHNLSFNFLRDITPVAVIDRVPLVMDVHPSLPVRTVPELISYAKANPGKISMGSGGVGSPIHMAEELFMMMTGVEMVHVPFRGEALALTDLLGGHVQVVFGSITASAGYIASGKVRALAVTTSMRSDLLPDIPTIGEFVTGYEASALHGIGAPKNTPTEIVATLNKEINAGLADRKTRAQLAELGSTVLAGSPADFGRLIANETEKWAKVIKFAGIESE